MQEVARLAANDDDNIHITVSKSQVFFGFANLQIASRLIMGQFPDYRQVIPGDETFISRICVSRTALIESLELASVVSREISKGRGSIICLTLEEDKINLYSSSQDEGTFDENVSALVEGEKLELNYNARYLLDVLRVMDDERIELRLTGANTPGIIQADVEDKTDKDRFLYLILPVRINK